MNKLSEILLKLLGVLLLVSAGLKAHEALTVPMSNTDIWNNRAFLIITIEFELTLGIWLLSGIFKKAAWLAVLCCFVIFTGVTFYKAISGYSSCGCFGAVHVNPWRTLFVIDIPIVILLLVFKPVGLIINDLATIVKNPIKYFTHPLPNLRYFGAFFFVGVATIVTSAPVIAMNPPAKTTEQYIVLDPETWTGEELPILEYFDPELAEQIGKGNWLIMFYHHDCPDCLKAMSDVERIAATYAGDSSNLRLLIVEVPPYGEDLPVGSDIVYRCRLPTDKKWFVSTPVFLSYKNGVVLELFPNEGIYIITLQNY